MVILTEKRNELLNGNYDMSDSTDRAAKHRLKTSSQSAIDDLIKIAQSPHIDNSEALPPEKIGELIEALYIPTLEPEDYHENYRKDLYYHVSRCINADIEDFV